MDVFWLNWGVKQLNTTSGSREFDYECIPGVECLLEQSHFVPSLLIENHLQMHWVEKYISGLCDFEQSPNKTAWDRLAFLAVDVFVPLMLQKPSARSKPREHNKYLATRVQKWDRGEISSILKEGKEIKKKIKKAFARNEQLNDRFFLKNMFLGKNDLAAKTSIARTV